MPAEAGVVACLVDVFGPAGCAICPGGRALGAGVGERIRVVDVKGEDDVGSFLALNGEVRKLEWVASKLLADGHLSRRREGSGRGSDESDGGGDEGGELHCGGDAEYGGV